MQELFIPRGAANDLRALIELDAGQMAGLAKLLGDKERTDTSGDNLVAEISQSLNVSAVKARSIFFVASYLLQQMHENDLETEDAVQAIIDHVSEFFRSEAPELIADEKAKRKSLTELLNTASATLLIRKIRLLSSGPSNRFLNVRTITDLRPVFEDDDELASKVTEIAGYLPVTHVIVDILSAGGDSDVAAFSLSPKDLGEFIIALERAKSKLDLIQKKHKGNLFSDDQ